MRYCAIFIFFLFCFKPTLSQKLGFELQAAHSSQISKLLLSSNNELLFSSEYNDNAIHVWQTSTGKKLKKLGNENYGLITDYDYDKKNNVLLILNTTGNIIVWDCKSGEQKKVLTINEPGSYNSIKVNVNGTKIVFNQAGKSFAIDSLNLNVSANLNVSSTIAALSSQNQNVQQNNRTESYTLNDTSYMCILDNIYVIYQNKKGKRKQVQLFDQSLFKKYTHMILADRKLICSTQKGDIIITTLKGKKIAAYKFAKASISSLCLSEDKKLLVIGNALGEIVTLNISTGTIVSRCTGLNKPISGINYSKDGNTLYIIRNLEIITYNYNNNTCKRLNLKDEMKAVSIDSVSGDSVVFLRYIKGQSLFGARWNCNKNIFLSKELMFAGSSGNTFVAYQNSIVQNKDSLKSTKVYFSWNTLYIQKAGEPLMSIVTDHSSSISAIKVNKVYNYVSTASADGKVKHWDIKTGEQLFTSIILTTNTYIHLLPNGYYYGTKHIFNSLNCVKGCKTLPNFQMDAEYNRPDLVIKKIPQHDSLLAAAIEHSYQKRQLNSANTKLKESELILSAEKTAQKEGMLSLKIKVISANSDISKINVFVNGVNENIILNEEKKEMEITPSVELANGTNKIEIYAQDKSGSFSNKISLTEVNEKKLKPDLYLICIGSAKFTDAVKNLNYADKDAKDVFGLFSNSKIYNSIHKLLLVNQQVTNTIPNDIEKLLSTASKNDVVILFYAGHGILNKDMDYYLSAYDVDFIHPEAKGIAYEKIESVLQNCRARQKLFFIDACHSGDIEKESAKQVSGNTTDTSGAVVFRSGTTQTHLSQNELSLLLSKELFATAGNSSGTSIIGASMGSQYALESNKWNNGVFTYALLLAIDKRKADYNHDKKIMLDELQYFINKSVEELTEGKQKPTTRTENLIGNMRMR